LKDWARNVHLWNIHASLGYPWQAERDAGLWTRCWAFLLRPLSGKFASFRLIPHYGRDGRLLEIGSGAGDFLAELRGKGWNSAEGIELNPDAADTARRRGFPVACGPVENLLGGFPDNHFDVIVSAMVLEHLLNPFEVLRAIAAKLKPGGEFLFSTVVRDALDARLYEAFWRGLELPRHTVFFTQDDLRAALRGQFEFVEHVHHNMPNDFVLSARWRGKRLDWIIGRLFASPLGWPAGFALAALHQTSRVSFRCRKKAASRTS